MRDLSILVVDDEEVNVLLVRRVLERAGYTQVRTTTDPARVCGLCAESEPDLVVLDLHMPGVDGFGLMQRLGRAGTGVGTPPFLVLTADVTEETRRRALELGARDFVTKPFSPVELLLRIRNLLEVQHLQRRLLDQNARLEEQVGERTDELEEARLEVVSRLALAAEYRDDDTQEHAWRVGRTCGLLADALGLADWQSRLIARAAPLHDIGKIGIPDSILLKPGRLTDEEFAQIKTHTTIGAEILSGSETPLLRLAERLALSHHERWDGGGYPYGLSGEEIPLAGRIVAIADVFDALTHSRPYKPACSVPEAVAEVVCQRGRQFDPGLVDAFTLLDHSDLLRRMDDAGSSPSAPRRRNDPLLDRVDLIALCAGGASTTAGVAGATART